VAVTQHADDGNLVLARVPSCRFANRKTFLN
jgi:hypothetical protein